ncbi:MAG: class I SAM-dependent methyltransferase family protein [Nanoarchaeota archaeon]|nr:class I SAM-dependent methyltransferase family protein [Nanoarchaeota archaeon]
MNVKDILKEKLSEEQIKELKTSFDQIGEIAIIEVPEELVPKEKVIAEAIMKVNKNIKTVCKKLGERAGELRLRSVKVISGKKKTETIHKEHGCRFKLDVKKDYFSPRESTERQRIAEQVKPGETVLVMFSGVGPFSIVIAKKARHVYEVELNKHACKMAEENKKLNKLNNIITVCGDVKKEVKQFYGKCDRVLMPLPKEAHAYLPEAIKCVKQSGVVHMYHVSHESDMFSEPVKLMRQACKKQGVKCKILGKRKVLPYGPRTCKVCIDFEVRI